MTQLAGPLTRVALPMIATRREEAALQAVLLRAHVLLCYTVVAGFAVLAALAQPVILVLLGEGWAPSVPIFRILAIAGAFQALAYVYYWAYLATGRTRRQLLVAFPGRLLMIGGAFAVAPLGGVGMAVLIAAGMVVLWVSNSVVGVRGLGIDPRPLLVTTARVIMVFTACSAATVLVDGTLLASGAALLRLIVGAAAWALTLCFAALLLHGVRRDLLTVFRFVRPAA
jgi:PST family polysaccharide transporter